MSAADGTAESSGVAWIHPAPFPFAAAVHRPKCSGRQNARGSGDQAADASSSSPRENGMFLDDASRLRHNRTRATGCGWNFHRLDNAATFLRAFDHVNARGDRRADARNCSNQTLRCLPEKTEKSGVAAIVTTTAIEIALSVV